MSLCEIISFDSEHKEDNGFFIAVKTLNNKTVQRKPLSAWGLTKELKTSLIVRTEIPNLNDLEKPTSVQLYQVDLTYSVNPSAKSLFLKQETQESDNGTIISKIFLRDVNNFSCQQLPLPNENYQDQFDITIARSKGKLISIKDSVALLKSGKSLGIFTSDLTKKLLL